MFTSVLFSASSLQLFQFRFQFQFQFFCCIRLFFFHILFHFFYSFLIHSCCSLCCLAHSISLSIYPHLFYSILNYFLRTKYYLFSLLFNFRKCAFRNVFHIGFGFPYFAFRVSVTTFWPRSRTDERRSGLSCGRGLFVANGSSG